MSILGIIVFVFLQSLSELFLPTLMSKIVDKGIALENISYIWKIGGLMLFVAIVGTVFSIIASYLTAQVSVKFGRDLRLKVFAHVEEFSLHEFDRMGTASLITRTTNDITQVQNVLNSILRMMISAPLMAIGGIILAFSMDAKIALVIVAAIPLLMLSIFMVMRKGIPLFKKVQIKLDQVNRVLREHLTGVKVIRSFNRTNYEKERFNVANHDLVDTSIKVNKLMATLMPFMMLVMNYTSIAIVWFSAIRIQNGHMQVGTLMALIQYAALIMFSMIMLSMMFVFIPRGAASAERINEVLELKPTIKETGKEKKSIKKGYVEFKDVTYSYPGAEAPALSHISFQTNPGEMTAIIGGTGSGKSTLMKLILRFYDVDSGSILVDDVNVQDLPLVGLRKKIGMVPQKVMLFSGTVAENIRYGKDDASDEDVMYAATIAQATDFISNINDGFASKISQGGKNLSGGQKQRIAIARALVRKPEIYIFDDSFSALDYQTEAKLRAALKKETTESTVFIVAQRVSTIMDADTIIVLEKGKIAGIGKHQELMKTCEVYQEIVSSQVSKEEIS